MSITLTALQKQRTDTAANWTSANPTLLSGELGFESDTGKMKLGDGSTAWNSLAYLILIPSSGVYPGTRLIMPIGTAGAPPLTFTGDINTGIYSPGADQVSVSTGGSEKLRIDNTGQIEAVSLGTAAAPTYTFNTDQNTGIYSPGADQVAISTGGSGRLFVSSSGSVGINQSNPATRLDVNGNSRVSGGGLRVDGYYSDGVSPYNLSIGTTGNIGYLQAVNVGALSDLSIDGSPIIFRTGSYAERLRITSAGLVGIGTSSPDYNLEVEGSVGTAYSGTARNTFLGLYNSNTTSGAYVGIELQVSGTGNASLANISAIDAGSGSTDLAFGLRNSNTFEEKVRIKSSGNVGIGTQSPDVNFVVSNGGTSSSASGGTLARVVGSGVSRLDIVGGNTNYSILEFSRANLTAAGQLSYEHSTNSLSCTVNGNQEAWRVDSSKRLLVGTSTARGDFFNTSNRGPSLQVEGTTTNTSGISVTSNQNNDNGPEFNFGKSRGTNTGSSTIVSSGDGLGRISFQGTDGSELVPAAYIEATVDGTPGANDMPGRLVFSTTADGASSPTERLKIDRNGTLFTVPTYNNTTTVAANTVVFSDGSIGRSTSSGKYKTDVETLEDRYADALLQCRPVWYRSTAPGDITHPDWGYWGFIAEEVAKVDPRLVFWKTVETSHDKNGSVVQTPLETPEPEGVQYDRFVPHLLNLIKRQQQAIEDLQAEVAALKAQ